jgi:DNA-binding GntR family transcriptional regulator
VPRLERVSTVEALVSSLRSRVLAGHLAPGTQLREVELAEAYGVGRHSLRAALQVLVLEGLLRHEANRGVFVPQLSHEDVRDLFLLRTPLEVEAVRVIVRQGIPIPRAVEVVEALEALRGDEPWDEVIELDLSFHRALIQGLGSPRFTRTFGALLSELRLLLAQLKPHYERVDQIGAEHREVLEAILGGRVQRAERAVRQHMAQGVIDILGVVEEPAARGRRRAAVRGSA